MEIEIEIVKRRFTTAFGSHNYGSWDVSQYALKTRKWVGEFSLCPNAWESEDWVWKYKNQDQQCQKTGDGCPSSIKKSKLTLLPLFCIHLQWMLSSHTGESNLFLVYEKLISFRISSKTHLQIMFDQLSGHALAQSS